MLALLGGLVCGCAPKTAPSDSGSRGDINELNLLGMPVALNLDDRPGADGVMVKLFAANRNLPRALPIQSGTLEIKAYEGTPSLAALPAPFHTWTYSPANLATSEFTTALGTGYNLVLSWIPKLLPSGRVTVIARYLPEQGEPVVSAPSSITAIAY